ncbi:MAG: hypothetical protein ACXWL5_04270 [Candidatus Chromulinivorax sp.]
MKIKKIYLTLILLNSFTNSLIASTNKKRSREKRCTEIEIRNEEYLKKQKIDFNQNLKALDKAKETLTFLEKALKNPEILKFSDYSGLYFNEFYDRSEGEHVITGEKTPQEREMAIKNLIKYRVQPEYDKLRTKILKNDAIKRSLVR